MLWTGGNGTGLSYCLKYADDSTDENPVVLAKGVYENGKEFEQRIYINDVNPSNATVVMPGIAAYETLQRVMPKEEALQIVHGYVERLARTSHKQLATLLLIPGLYRLVPGVFVKSTRSVFGPAAGFDSKELQVGNGIWRVDMMKCPYHDTCVAYGCPELCCCFCDSDDISYTGLHPKLIWHRTKTLGRGDDRCDFCMKIMK